ncbi:hypothetical protein HYH03_013513 [Edaphochlamys debaryana]|uniref:Uncharacterized protein n=1 Tax=Edaphochlamys debaryana TaxID=47281 RepID=A0A835XQN1_9CHLO|nr:hypothetical protein HYH03_013513 [Edaphochlamys debaryana]|eukprot:KAG2487934.1 hypothetical protein HYH03_013513 [Edaphochlamys debaryana]
MQPLRSPRRQQDREAKQLQAAVWRLRACCSLEELVETLEGFRSDQPPVLVEAAVQGARLARGAQGPGAGALLHRLLGAVAGHCAMHLERYDLPLLAALLGACARARHTPEELLLPLQLRLAGEARRVGPPEDAAPHLAALATHLSRLRVTSPRLWAALGAAAAAALPRASAADVAALLAAHARVDAPNAALFERGAARAAAELHDAQPQDVATLVWALARAHHPLPRGLARALAQHLGAGAGAGGYSLVQVASLAGACGRLRVSSAELRLALSQRGAEALLEEAAALASHAAGNHASLRQLFSPQSGPLSGALSGSGPRSGVRSRPSVTAPQPPDSEAVAVLVAGLGALGPHDPALLRAAATFLTAVAEAAAEAGEGDGGAAGLGLPGAGSGEAGVQAPAGEVVAAVAAALRAAGLVGEAAELEAKALPSSGAAEPSEGSVAAAAQATGL